jgi:predicted metal-binding membrane protein
VHSSLSVADPARRDRLLIFGCLVVITAIAWAYLVRLARHPSSAQEYEAMMAAMGMAVDRPWTTADFFFTFAMWAVMMVGMMAGSAAPVLLLFAATRRGRDQQHGVPMSVLFFGLGYLTVWIGFSAEAAVVQWALQRAALLTPAMSSSNPWLSAGILIAAGAYQLSPFKGACLTQCRSPLGFLMSHWGEGDLGALRMGIVHGVYCLGCCWALMVVLFAVGVMNLAWVAAISVVVLIEKIAPGGAVFSRIAGVTMIVAGLYAITRGLT